MYNALLTNGLLTNGLLTKTYLQRSVGNRTLGCKLIKDIQIVGCADCAVLREFLHVQHVRFSDHDRLPPESDG